MGELLASLKSMRSSLSNRYFLPHPLHIDPALPENTITFVVNHQNVLPTFCLIVVLLCIFLIPLLDLPSHIVALKTIAKEFSPLPPSPNTRS